jgi:two-component system invasion response regulator UvrY
VKYQLDPGSVIGLTQAYFSIRIREFFVPDNLIQASASHVTQGLTQGLQQKVIRGPIRVLLVDDHDLVRMGIRRLLSDAKELDVVGEASSGEEAIERATLLKPDVILMDIKMPGMGGLEAIKRLSRSQPHSKILAVTVYGDEPYPTLVLQAGAIGYITKGASASEMIVAIKTVNSGRKYISTEIAQQLALKHLDHKKDNPFEGLSEREMQVFILTTSGRDAQSIAEQLCISPKTVNTYRYRLFEKLGVENDVGLTHLAVRYGFVQSGDL